MSEVTGEGPAQTAPMSFSDAVSRIREVRDLAADIEGQKATAGSVAADLAIMHCVLDDSYGQLERVKNFWETVNTQFQEHPNELAVCSNPSNILVAGRILRDNNGVQRQGRSAVLPVANGFAATWEGDWLPVQDRRLFSLGSGYVLQNLNKDVSAKYPHALNGFYTYHNGAYGGVALGIGNDATRLFLEDEYAGFGHRRRRGLGEGQRPGQFAKREKGERDVITIDPQKVFDFLMKNA